MKRRGEVATALVIAILALGIGAAGYYVWKSQQGTSGDMNVSRDSKQEQENKKVEELVQEITSELSSKFGEFSSLASLESYDFVPRLRTEWGKKSLYQAGDKSCFIVPEEFVQKFISLAEADSLTVAQDGSKFSIDIRNGKDFNLDETLAELLHQVSGLKSGVSGNSSNSVDMNDVASKLVNRVKDKSAESYGYMRFIFKTNVDDVYVVAVFSIDPNEETYAKGRYIATGKNLLISRSSDEILNRIRERLDLSSYFYTLEFDLRSSNFINSNSSPKECLEEFIREFGE